MPELTIQQAFELALQYHQAGRLGEAEQWYQQILAVCPGHIDSIHNLGVAAFQTGRNDIAAGLFRRTIALSPTLAEAHSNLGNALIADNKLVEAIASYRRAIELKPNYPEALINLGVALKDNGELDQSIEIQRQAIALNPNLEQAHYNLGLALQHKGQFDDAMDAYRRTIELRPDYAEAHNNLAALLNETGKFDQAMQESRQAIALKPDLAVAHFNLATALKAQKQFAGAIAAYEQTLSVNPAWVEVRSELGNLLLQIGESDRAIAVYRQAILFNPQDPDAYCNLGIALNNQGKTDAAAVAYRQAIAIKPDFAKAHNNLGSVLGSKGEVDEAIREYLLALETNPNMPVVLNNLGGAYKDKGQIEQALAAYRNALELKPDYAEAQSNLVYARLFHHGSDTTDHASEARRWAEQHAEPLRDRVRPHANEPSVKRVLRIGYVSPDFRDHVVGRNLIPLFRQHDRQSFEIACYSEGSASDPITDQFKDCATLWRNTTELNDEEVAELIRADQIDILVDLALHMANHRLLVFAQKPAPIQATFAGYPGTTGLSTVDYRISDEFLDPPGADESVYAEQTIRLPDSFWCYDPLDTSDIPINDLPALCNGFITFACLNNYCKINDQMLSIWARVMAQVPGSRLLMIAKAGDHQQHACDHLEQHGVDRSRIEFLSIQSRRDYLKIYHRIDLSLDSFPYNGHTTSLDSLWMGVPVVTLVGQTAVSRAGWCQLSNLALQELAAHDPEDFIRIAVNLAVDLPRLRNFRSTLRSRMERSPLMDAPRFARSIESAYRTMWLKWCESAAR